MTLRLLLYGAEQVLMELPCSIVLIEFEVIRIIRIRMDPYGILASLKPTSENGGKRTGTKLGVSYGQHVCLQRTVSHIPVEITGTPLGVEPFLVKAFRILRHGYVGMGLHSVLEVLPHVEHYPLVVPPVDIMFLCLFKIFFPGLHFFLSLKGSSVHIPENLSSTVISMVFDISISSVQSTDSGQTGNTVPFFT